MLLCVLWPLLAAAWPVAAQDGPNSEAAAAFGALGADDECRAGSLDRCSLSAVQLLHQRLSPPADQPEPAEGDAEEAEPPKGDTKEADPVQGDAEEAEPSAGDAAEAKPAEGEAKEPEPAEPAESEAKEPEPASGDTKEAKPAEGEATEPEPAEAAPAPAPVALVPYQQCGGKWYEGSTECPAGHECVNVDEYYAQCKPEAHAHAEWRKYRSNDLLDNESTAPVLEFYMYRAWDKESYPLASAAAGSIGAVMWYLHVDATSPIPATRQQNPIKQIARYRVQTRATEPLYRAGMNFGLAMAFYDGQCLGPGQCHDAFDRYGYYVGCKDLSAGYPHPLFPVHYTGTLYSLPGGCPAHRRGDKTWECKVDQPGGLCNGVPLGTGNCTWSYMAAGTVTLDELEGVSNSTDSPSNFWDGLDDQEADATRVKKLDAVFKKKYPEEPSDDELPSPPCDFDMGKFYSKSSA